MKTPYTPEQLEAIRQGLELKAGQIDERLKLLRKGMARATGRCHVLSEEHKERLRAGLAEYWRKRRESA